jgi:hypothetical protein
MMDDKFKRHVIDTYNVSERDFERLYEEFLEHFGSSLEDYIRHRHFQLKAEGKKNDIIFRALIIEAARRRFPAQALTERKVRRMVYG